jgi:hypothetical protein
MATTELHKGVNKTGMNEMLSVLREGFRSPEADISITEAMTDTEDKAAKPTEKIKKRIFRGLK